MPSQAEIEQYQQDVEELSALAIAEVAAVIVAAMDDGTDRPSIVKAIAAVLEPYLVAVMELAVDWYRGLARTTAASPPNPARARSAAAPLAGPTDRIALLDATDFVPRPAPLPPTEQIESTAWWALSAADEPEPVPTEERTVPVAIGEPDQQVGARVLSADETSARARVIPSDATPAQARVITRMAGATQRLVTTAARDTVTENADREGVRWRRHAQPDACAFCRLLATRDDYLTEESAKVVVGRRGRPRGKRKLGELYHDYCQCEPVAVRAGDSYTPPEQVAEWDSQYGKAVAEVGNSRDVKKILAAMRRLSIASGGTNR